MTPGELVHTRRMYIGLELGELGEMIGYGPAVAKQIIWAIENNRRLIPQSKIKKLAKILNLPVDSLIQDS